jgi:DNA polymerase I-like protein with 3'-5' exonuclease and polymerase domains
MLVPNPLIITLRKDYFIGLGWPEDRFIDCQDALEKLEFQGQIALDVETSGLNSAHLEKLHSIQVGIPGYEFIFDIETITPSVLKRPLETNLLIVHNYLFDGTFLNVHGIFPKSVFCTLTSETCLSRGIKVYDRSLGALVERYCGKKIDKSLQKDVASGLDSVEKIQYAATDITYLPMIMEEQKKLLAKYGMEKHAHIKNQFCIFLCYMEYCGIGVDIEALYEFIRETEAEEWGMMKKLKAQKDINWRSTQQVAEVLKEFGIEEVNEETGNAQTGIDILNKHTHIPLIADLVEYRALSKKVNSYGRKWLFYPIKGRIHTRYKQGTGTGRTSCGASDKKKYEPWDVSYKTSAPFPNLQQVFDAFKHIFVAGRGQKFIEADFTGQESVILADQSEEPNLLKFYREGKSDLHSFVAKLVFPELGHLSDEELKTQHPDKRQMCKSAAFAIAYGGNGSTISNNLNIPEEQGNDVYERYMKAFPQIKEFFKKCYDYSARSGYTVMDPFGGKRFMYRGREFKEKYTDKAYWEKYWDEKRKDSKWFKNEKESMRWFHGMAKELRKESVNTRIQSTAATMSAIAGNYMLQYIYSNKLIDKIKVVCFVHDSIVLQCSEKIAEKTAKVLQACMEQAGKECLKNLPIKCDVRISDSWGK